MLIYLWLRRHTQGRDGEDLQLHWRLRLASLAPVDGPLVLFRSGLDIKSESEIMPYLMMVEKGRLGRLDLAFFLLLQKDENGRSLDFFFLLQKVPSSWGRRLAILSMSRFAVTSLSVELPVRLGLMDPTLSNKIISNISSDYIRSFLISHGAPSRVSCGVSYPVMGSCDGLENQE